jgi:hypothetical protein
MRGCSTFTTHVSAIVWETREYRNEKVHEEKENEAAYSAA